MKEFTTSIYQKRLLVLVALAAMILTPLVKTKLMPAWVAWNAHREMKAGSASMADLDRERASLEVRATSLEKRMGAQGDALDGWRTVLDILAQQGEATHVELAGVAEEHISSQLGFEVHTLPLSLEGRTDELVRLVDAVERNGRGVFLLAVDLHAKEIAYNKPRQLTATLYLQTLSK